MNKLKANTV